MTKSNQKEIRQKTALFVKKARNIHGNRYDYERTIYQSSASPVTIICGYHGDFSQKPEKHLMGRGCPKCGTEKASSKRRKTTKQFIKEAKAVHGKQYQYHDVVYENAHKPVRINCPDHGEFKQTPACHLGGQGCPECGKIRRGLKKRKSLSEFIKEANKVHNNFYSYKKVIYQGNKQHVEIICPLHGPFFQAPTNHIRGQGCQECSKIRISQSYRKLSAEFIAEARIVHNNRYTYQLDTYINKSEKIKINCQVHGTFTKFPAIHLRGKGCPKCARQSKAEFQTKTTDQFIMEARQVHNDIYSYEQTQYVNCKEPVSIVCKTHGVFKQSPELHLTGRGCSLCGQQRSNDAKRKSLDHFIAEANTVHNNRYLYDQCVYHTINTHVKIKCPEHGYFKMVAGRHLNGAGCPKCGLEEYRKKRQENFIKKAREVHGNRYGYDQVHYIRKDIRVTLICPVHGEFQQTPAVHLRGANCRQCSLDLYKLGYFRETARPLR